MARKNGNGEGSRPRKRPDGRWEARYWAETPTGKKRRSVYGKSRKEVAEKLTDAMATKDDAPVSEPTNVTVAEFLAEYEEVAKETLKRRSYETYRDIARLHLLPAFSSLKLNDLSREHIQRMYTRKCAQGAFAG